MKVKSIKSKAILSLAIFAMAIGLVWLAMSVIDKASADENHANEANELPTVTYSINPQQCISYCNIDWQGAGTGNYIELSFSDESEAFALNAVAENKDPDFPLYGEISVDKTWAMSEGWEFQGVFIDNEPISLDQKIYEDCNLEFRFSEIPSGPANVKFTYEFIDDPGAVAVPEYKLTEDDFAISYNAGDPIQVNVGDEVTSEDIDYNGAFVTVSGETEYTFDLYAPYGYDLDSVSPDINTISEDTTFVFKLKKYTGQYHIDFTAKKQGGGYLEGYKVVLHDPDWNVIKESFTDVNGNCKFDLNKDQANCSLEGEKAGYQDVVLVLSSFYYNPDNNHTYSETFSIPTADQADLTIYSNSPAHKYFEVVLRVTLIDDPSVVLMERKLKKESLITQMDGVYGEFVVQANGTLHCQTVSEDEGALIVLDIIPTYDEGINFNHWAIDQGDGVVKNYVAGDKFLYYPGHDLLLKGEIFYGEDPTPTPSEEVNAAQTGDSAPLVPFVLLAVLAGGVLLYTRKASQK